MVVAGHPGEQLVGHTGQRVLIGAPVHLVALNLLRSRASSQIVIPSNRLNRLKGSTG
jgi:hypothetical protein